MIAAPFLGEFGWQVSLWVPWLRWLRQELYAARDFTVICKPGHEGLYEDFATKVIPHEVTGITRIDCEMAWMNGVQVKGQIYEDIIRQAIDKPRGRTPPTVTPLSMNYSWPPGRPPLPMKGQATYQLYGGEKKRVDPRLIAIHARMCEKQPERNWSASHWEQMLEKWGIVGRHFAFVGSVEDSIALNLPQAEDMRGISVKEEVEILSHCGMMIGPSSGPLHLANHCGTPVVWWADGEKNIERYDTAWNPFKVPNKCVTSADWRPTPEQVVACLRQS